MQNNPSTCAPCDQHLNQYGIPSFHQNATLQPGVLGPCLLVCFNLFSNVALNVLATRTRQSTLNTNLGWIYFGKHQHVSRPSAPTRSGHSILKI